MVVLNVEPAIDPGLIVQLPAGNPLNSTLPVATAQVGCVIALTGADGTVFTVRVAAFDVVLVEPAQLVT